MKIKKRQAFKIMKSYSKILWVNPGETRRKALYDFFGYPSKLKKKFVDSKVKNPDIPLPDGGFIIEG